VSTRASYWQTVAQVVSKETQPILDELHRMDDGAVREWAKGVESLGLVENGGRF
jgi:hypothetical protein